MLTGVSLSLILDAWSKAWPHDLTGSTVLPPGRDPHAEPPHARATQDTGARPALLQPRENCSASGPVRSGPSRQRRQPQRRIGLPSGQQILERLGVEPKLAQPPKQGSGRRQHLLLPVAVADSLEQGTGVVFQGAVQRQSVLQPRALEGAQAEAVDRGDVGPVEILQSQQQPAPIT